MKQKFETMDDLFLQGEDWAEYCMRGKEGFVRPALMWIPAKGPSGMFFHRGDCGEADKQRFSKIAQLLCLAHGAVACCLVIEAWYLKTTVEAYEAEGVTPSQSPERIEAVVMFGQDSAGHCTKVLNIVRHDNRKFFSLVKVDVPSRPDECGGQFTNLLPKVPPTEEMKFAASLMLDLNGIKVAGIVTPAWKKKNKL